jgi:hypothetical protein
MQERQLTRRRRLATQEKRHPYGSRSGMMLADADEWRRASGLRRSACARGLTDTVLSGRDPDSSTARPVAQGPRLPDQAGSTTSTAERFVGAPRTFTPSTGTVGPVQEAFPPIDGASLPYCERCGHQVGPPTKLMQVGIRMCGSCQVFACDRCWRSAAGACPGCGVLVAPLLAGPLAQAPGSIGAHRQRGPSGRRAPIAAGFAAMAVLGVTLALATSLSPTGDVESALGTPAGPHGGGPVLAAQAPPSNSAGGGIGPVTAQPTRSGRPSPRIGLHDPGQPTNGAANPTTQPPVAHTDPPAGGGPAPTAAPTSTPSPVPVPTASPPTAPPVTPGPSQSPVPTTPSPTDPATPTPTPACQVVPDFSGMTVGHARAAWKAAGFTGAFSPDSGLNNMIVQTQSEPAGACLGADATIVVTYG